MGKILIKNAMLFDGARIAMVGRRVRSAAPADAEVLDAGGSTIHQMAKPRCV